jgi:hypothetical protein
MTTVKKEEVSLIKLSNQDHFQTIDEVDVLLRSKRKLQQERNITIEVLDDIDVIGMKENAIQAIKSINGISEEQRLNMIDATNDYYESFPITSCYFVGNADEGNLSHMVVRTSGDEEGIIYPLSDLAKTETLYKYFNLNQRTMESFNAYKQMNLINGLFNEGKFNVKTKSSKVLRGNKKIRINHLGEVRSFHSNIYKFIDHIEMLDKIKQFLSEEKADKFDIVLDERYLLLYFILKNYSEKYEDGVINAGLCVYNSEVGLGSLQVYTFLNVKETKFLIKPGNSVYEFREIHKGKDESPAESLENFSNHLNYATNYIIEVINRYKQMESIKVTNPGKTMEAVCNRYQDLRAKKVKAHLIEQAEAIDNVSFRDIIHLVSNLSLSKKHGDINFRHSLQRNAGELINLTDEQILKLL